MCMVRIRSSAVAITIKVEMSTCELHLKLVWFIYFRSYRFKLQQFAIYFRPLPQKAKIKLQVMSSVRDS